MPSGPFEALLIDAAQQAARAVSASESVLRRVEQVSSDMFRLREQIAREMSELSQRVTALESVSAERKEWDGVERREVRERLGSGDHTFQKLQTELELMKKDTEACAREVLEVNKALIKREQARDARVEKTESRRHAILMLILKYAVPPIISGIGAMAGFYFMLMKGGRP